MVYVVVEAAANQRSDQTVTTDCPGSLHLSAGENRKFVFVSHTKKPMGRRKTVSSRVEESLKGITTGVALDNM
jgi:hypothetical protein